MDNKLLFAPPTKEELDAALFAPPSQEELNIPNQEHIKSMHPILKSGLAFEKGAEQGVTLGQADELAGGTQKLLQGLASIGVPGILPEGITQTPDEVNQDLLSKGFTGKDLNKTTYESARDDARKEYSDTREQNPISYITGDLAGGLVGMGAISKLAKLGQTGDIVSKALLSPAGQSAKNASIIEKMGRTGLNAMPLAALTGAGTSTSDNALDIAKDSLEGAKTGFEAGSLLQGVGTGVFNSTGALGDKVRPFFESKMPNTANAYDYGKEGISAFGTKFNHKTNSLLNDDLITPIQNAFTSNAEQKMQTAAIEEANILNQKNKQIFDDKVRLTNEISDTQFKLDEASNNRQQFIDQYNFEKSSGDKKSLQDLNSKIKESEQAYAQAEKEHALKIKEADAVTQRENDLVIEQNKAQLKQKELAKKTEQAELKAQKEEELKIAKQKANETLLNQAQGDKLDIKNTYDQIDNTLQKNGIKINKDQIGLNDFSKDIKKIRPGEDTDALVSTFDDLIDNGNMDIKQKRLFVEQLREFKAKNPEYTKPVNNLIKRTNDALEENVTKAGLDETLSTLKQTNNRYYKLNKLEDDVIGKLDYDRDLGRVVSSDKLNKLTNNLDNQVNDAEVFGKIKDAKDVANFYSPEFGNNLNNIEQDLISRRGEINAIPQTLQAKYQPDITALDNAIAQGEARSKQIATDRTLPKEVSEQFEAQLNNLRSQRDILSNKMNFIDKDPSKIVTPQTPHDEEITKLQDMLDALKKPQQPSPVLPQPIKAKPNYVESMQTNPEKISSEVKANISNLNSDLSTTSQDKINNILKSYREMTGKNLNDVANEVSKRVNILGENSEGIKTLHILNPNFYGSGIGNALGLGINKLDKAADFTVQHIPVIISALQSKKTPLAKEYSQQLENANGKDQQNAKLFDLKQQPGFRSLFDDKKKEK
jgi:hypothetical protein